MRRRTTTPTILGAIMALLLASGCSDLSNPLNGSDSSQRVSHPVSYDQFLQRENEIGDAGLDLYAKIADSLSSMQPTMPPEEMVEAMWKSLVSYEQSEVERSSERAALSGYPYALTSAEKWLLLTNPWYAPQTKSASDKATAEALRQWPGDQHNTRADAFRHAFWNVLLSKYISISWAEKYTNAHESASPDGLEKRMDLNNNVVGRGIYMANRSKSETELSSTVKSFRYVYVTLINASYTYLVYIKN